jgi:hypothetical protein
VDVGVGHDVVRRGPVQPRIIRTCDGRKADSVICWQYVKDRVAKVPAKKLSISNLQAFISTRVIAWVLKNGATGVTLKRNCVISQSSSKFHSRVC